MQRCSCQSGVLQSDLLIGVVSNSTLGIVERTCEQLKLCRLLERSLELRVRIHHEEISVLDPFLSTVF